MTRPTNDERYEAKFVRGGDDECWPWTAAPDKDGYGIFWGGDRYPHNGRPKMVKATRFGWQRLHGPIPAGLLVCHTCDNPPCQNPTHWFLDNNAGNMADMKKKKRGTGPGRGENHPSSVISDAQLAEARAKYTGAYGQQTALAKEYGISRRSMAKLLRGQNRHQL